VYMVASKSRVLYIGMTNNLHRRIFEHKNDLVEGFTRQYKCHRLVYFESFDDVNKAIDREKQLKRWNRTKERVVDRAAQPNLGGSGLRMVYATSVRAGKEAISVKTLSSRAEKIVSEADDLRSRGTCCWLAVYALPAESRSLHANNDQLR